MALGTAVQRGKAQAIEDKSLFFLGIWTAAKRICTGAKSASVRAQDDPSIAKCSAEFDCTERYLCDVLPRQQKNRPPEKGGHR
jgi:hypothetical protein